MLDLDTIFITDLKNRLPYKDVRSIKAWLKKNKVIWYGDKGSKRQYIFKVPFERALLQMKITDLNKSGADWATVFSLETELYNQYKKQIESREVPQRLPVMNRKVYKPFGESGNQFIQDLQNI